MSEKLIIDLEVRNNTLDKALDSGISKSDALESAIKDAVSSLSKPVGAAGINSALGNASTSAEGLRTRISQVFEELSRPSKTSSFSAALEKDTLSAKELSDGIGAAFQYAQKQSEAAAKSVGSFDNALLVTAKDTANLEARLKKTLDTIGQSTPQSPFNAALQQGALSAKELEVGVGAAFQHAKQQSEIAAKSSDQFGASLSASIKKALDFNQIMNQAAGVFIGGATFTALNELRQGFSDAAKEAVLFKRNLLEIETILPVGTKLTEELTQQLINLSKQYGTSASSQAKAYYEIISAGVSDAADGAKLLANANELATGGVTDTAKTIDLLTTIYNVYGKEVATTAEASDSLFKTVQLGKTTISQLSADLGQALPIAKSFRIGLDEVGSVLALLTNAGITTSESVTLLNAVLTAIARNGEKLGKGFNSTAVQTEGLGVVLERLRVRTKGSNDALFELLGRSEAVRAVQALTSRGLGEYNKNLDEYKTKAGSAAAASQLIIKGDVGKQFDILGANITAASSKFIGVFIPATLAATTALNNFLNPQISTDTAAQGVERSRARIATLNALYEKGSINVDYYNKQIAASESRLAVFANAAETAAKPLALISTGLETEVAAIKAQIGSIQNGFDELSLGPIERQLKLEDLNKKLDASKAKLAELTAVQTVAGPIVEGPEVRTQEAIKKEQQLQAELQAIRIQAAATAQTFEDELNLANLDSTTTLNEQITQQLYDQKVREAEALYQGELLKNAVIKDSQERRAADLVAGSKKEQAVIKAGNDKVLADTRAAEAGRVALEKASADARGTILSQSFQLAGALAKDGSRAQFAIQKAAAVAEIAIGDGKARALIPAQTATIPYPANLAAIAQMNFLVSAQTALGLGIVGASAIKGFAGGGIVGGEFNGAAGGGDDTTITARKDEMMLNAEQQKKLWDIIAGGGSAGNMTVVVQIDGREIARTVRDQIKSGYKVM